MDGRVSGPVTKSGIWHHRVMWIVDFLAPPSCVFCGSPSEAGEKSICKECFADLPWKEPAISPAPGIYDCSVAMTHYRFPIDAAIKALKFNRKLYFSSALVEILLLARPLLPAGLDAVLAVPLHWRRKAARGFNQATELARPVAKMLGVPLIRCVRRNRATPFQSGLNGVQRARNLRHAFVMKRVESYTHILIIDDVITTGATLEALAKLLLANGTARVSVLAVAGAGQQAGSGQRVSVSGVRWRPD